MRSSYNSSDTWDTRRDEKKWHRIETLRWERLTWKVLATDEADAQQRFEAGDAEGPITVDNDGQLVVEVRKMRWG